MRIKVKDELFNVIAISYDLVGAKKDNEKLVFKFDEVEFIYDNEFEELIIRNKEILKIKKPKGLSSRFYQVILEALNQFKGIKAIDNLEVIHEEHEIKKSITLVKLKMVVNNVPVQVDMVRSKTNQMYDIKITEIEAEDFINDCSERIQGINKTIDGYLKDASRVMRAMDLAKYKETGLIG